MQQLFLRGLVLFAAAFAAGMINSIAGGGTLLTFPALIAAGLDAKMANATSTVALWPGLLGGLFGFRREMEENKPLLLRLGLTSVAGGARAVITAGNRTHSHQERQRPPDQTRHRETDHGDAVQTHA